MEQLAKQKNDLALRLDSLKEQSADDNGLIQRLTEFLKMAALRIASSPLKIKDRQSLICRSRILGLSIVVTPPRLERGSNV